VIDPGVGTARRIVATRKREWLFVIPDNGLLSFVGVDEAVSVENESCFLPNGSSTFHGRDRFAPVAAAIANGTALAELGPRVDDLVRLDYTPPSYGNARVDGTIVAVDRFGNLITDVEAARIDFAPRLRAGSHVVDRVERSYGDATGGPFLIVGSTGCIELSVANGSAADLLQLSRGEKVSIVPK